MRLGSRLDPGRRPYFPQCHSVDLKIHVDCHVASADHVNVMVVNARCQSEAIPSCCAFSIKADAR